MRLAAWERGRWQPGSSTLSLPFCKRVASMHSSLFIQGSQEKCVSKHTAQEPLDARHKTCIVLVCLGVPAVHAPWCSVPF